MLIDFPTRKFTVKSILFLALIFVVFSISATAVQRDTIKSSQDWTAPSRVDHVDVLIVGGGGGGGTSRGGGGGAGEVITRYEVSVTPGNDYYADIGSGGAGATGSGDAGNNGESTSFLGYTASGGGGGASKCAKAKDGASGGGGAFEDGTGGCSTDTRQGGIGDTQGYGGDGYNSGTFYGQGGGGGGYGSDGGDAISSSGGVGGDGYDASGWGLNCIAGGGGGGSRGETAGSGTCGGSDGTSGTDAPAPNNADPNTGAGGGGGGRKAGSGGDGGSGIIVIEYEQSDQSTTLDSCDNHATEEVAWLAVDNGKVEAGGGSSTSGPQGAWWIEDNSMNWIGGDGLEYSETGSDTGNNPSSASPGNVWVENNDLRYIDENGNERYFNGQSSSTSAPEGSAWIDNDGRIYWSDGSNERYLTGATIFGQSGVEYNINDNNWVNVGLNSGYFSGTPVVLATTQTTGGGQDPSSAHVRNPSTGGFDTQHCEYNGDGVCDSHAAEDQGWLAIDPTVVNNQIPGMAAGTVTISGQGNDGTTEQINFPNSFSSAPLVFTTVNSEDGSDEPHVSSVQNVDSSSAYIQYCEQEGQDSCDSHTSETIGWLAIDTSNANKNGIFDWGTTNVDDSNWNSVSFSQSFSSAPTVIVDTQTENGGSEALYSEADNVDTNGASVRYCELG